MIPEQSPTRRSKKRNNKPSFVILLSLLGLSLVYIYTNWFSGEKLPGSDLPSGDEIVEELPPTALAPMDMALDARGVYVTFPAADPSMMKQIVEYVRETPGLNSFVVDLKDNDGFVPLPGPEGVPSKASSYRHYPGLIEVLRDEGYYMVARVVAFQDSYMANAAPDQAIRNADGSVWRDKDGRKWLNPYDKRNWEFTKDIALWAVDLGFHEVQLDYVRFPDGAGGLENSSALLPGKEDFDSRGDCIAAYLDYMSEALEDKAYLSADIFGFTTIAQDDMGIGQKLEQVADHVDFICPMVYPSHYFNAWIYGFEVPEAHPGEVVQKAMEEAILRTEGLRAKIRPWLQDFSLRIHYGKDEVQAQADAVFSHGINTFLMWNPANVYKKGVDYSPK